ncbi:UNVERIFIED_CONTAM: hypothetical protein NCL1_25869 [Trichonephila clavipes]
MIGLTSINIEVMAVFYIVLYIRERGNDRFEENYLDCMHYNRVKIILEEDIFTQRQLLLKEPSRLT